MINIVEIGGRGGVFQHSVEVARRLGRAGKPVTLHTARDHEQVDAGVTICGCFDWMRSHEPRRRKVLMGLRYAFVFIPHVLLVSRQSRSVVHIQGARPMCSGLVLLLVIIRRRCVFSPHNTFSRSHSHLEAVLLNISMRYCALLVLFSDADQKVVRRKRLTCVVPLVIYQPPVPADLVEAWRKRLGATTDQVLISFVGQIRPDKRPDLFIQALEEMPEYVGAVVGEDLGGLPASFTVPDNVVVIREYVSLPDFAAIVKASDVIAAPYRVASQSAVLAVARALGVRTVATSTGGLGELADRVMSEQTAQSLVAALKAVLATPARPGVGRNDDDEQLDVYRAARMLGMPA